MFETVSIIFIIKFDSVEEDGVNLVAPDVGFVALNEYGLFDVYVRLKVTWINYLI